MKISQMRQREDFYTILFNSVNEHCPELWNAESDDCDGYYYVYERLNAIVPDHTPPLIKQFIRDEFTYTNRYKNIISRIYIDLALTFPNLFCDRKLCWNNSGNRHKMIFPSNRKIRIMDFDDMESFVCMKDGFPDTMMKREIDFRMKHSKKPFILPIISSGRHYYTERIIKGRSIARIKDAEEKRSVFERALRVMKEFASEYIVKLNSNDYALSVYNEIENIAQGKYKVILTLCRDILSKIGSIDVNVSISHGDFQPGNIWIENGNIIIIDWETFDSRIAVYDELVFISNIRNSCNYIQALSGIKKYVYCLYGSGDYAENLFRIFVLEEIKWMIEEVKTLPENINSTAMDKIMKREVFQFIREFT